MTPLRIALLALLLFPLAACDSGSEPDEPEDDTPRFGSFEAELSGDLVLSLEGQALFDTFSLSPGEPSALSITMLQLDQPAGGRGLSVNSSPGAIIGTGSYALGEQLRQVTLFYSDRDGDELGFLLGSSGTLTITRYDESRVDGTFSATLSSFGTEVDVQVTGSFEAVRLEDPDS